MCNAGEHELGTFKDRHLLKHIPHQLIEGCLIASRTVNAKASYIYVNHEYEEEEANLRKAIAQAARTRFVGQNILGTGVDLDWRYFPATAVTWREKKRRCWNRCKGVRRCPGRNRRFIRRISVCTGSQRW